MDNGPVEQQSQYRGGYSEKAVEVLRLVEKREPYAGRSRTGRKQHLHWLESKGLIESDYWVQGYWKLTAFGKQVLEYHK